MLFSLIIPTIHRTLELARLLKSIAQQQLNGFKLGDMEAIIVDQNPDDRLVSVIEPYRGLFDVVRLTAPPLGQSNAKNIGMKSFRGQYLAFPDDDCFYAKDSLEKVLRAFRETKDESVVFGRGLDLESGKFLLEYPPASRVIRGPKNPDAFLGLKLPNFTPPPWSGPWAILTLNFAAAENGVRARRPITPCAPLKRAFPFF